LDVTSSEDRVDDLDAKYVEEKVDCSTKNQEEFTKVSCKKV